MYLTFQEWESMGFSTSLTETEFNQLLPFAEITIDNVTRYYYKFHDLNSDEKEFRKISFKRAVALLILYMFNTGIKTSSDFETLNAFSSISIGRTSVSKGSKNSTAQNNSNESFPPQEVYDCLALTGLLYRGVRYDR